MGQITIAGDWGTSRLRLYLCDDDTVIDRKAGPGAVGAGLAHEDVLFSLIQPWLDQHGDAPVLLCGMVGSRNGWIEAPYAPCPADAAAVRAQLVRFTARGVSIGIVPGVKGVSPRQAPDVMRGEETQIFGALRLEPQLAKGRHLLALPGTHTKWALVQDGRIETFQTAFAGELFALLRDHGTLTNIGGADTEIGLDGFEQGLIRHEQAGAAGLLHEVFETRSRQLLDGWSAAYALNFLSGLLIGNDVSGALTQFGGGDGPVTLIGDPQLSDRYSRALSGRGRDSQMLTGEACALAGLRALFQTHIEGDH